MTYTKFPERVIYGLLRDNISFSKIKADIEIEHSSNYETNKLDKTIYDQLNTHSIYREESFFIESCKIVHKRESLGLQIIDCLIGIVRDILILRNTSKRSW